LFYIKEGVRIRGKLMRDGGEEKKREDRRSRKEDEGEGMSFGNSRKMGERGRRRKAGERKL